MNALELGLGTALSKYIAEYRARSDVEAISSSVSIAASVYLGAGAVLTAALMLSSHRLARLFHPAGVPHAKVVAIVEIVSLGLLPLLILSCGLAVAVGMERFEIPMLAAVAQNGLTIVVAVVVVEIGGSVEDVVATSLVVLCVVAAAAAAAGVRLLRQMGARMRFARGYARRLLSYALFTGVTSAGSLLFGSVDRIAVGAALGLRAVTYYSVTISVANKLLVVADVAARPLMPAASGWFTSGRRREVHAALRRATFFTTACAAAVGGLMLALSGPVLRIWLGHAFAAEALTPFRVLIVVYAILAVAAPAFHVANGIGRAWLPALLGMLGGFATIALIFVLGRAHGLTGAAFANGAYLVNLAIPLVIALGLRTRPGQHADSADVAAASLR